MKVLHVIPSISSKRGGPSKAIIDMVRALRIEGVDASIISTSDNSFYSEEKWIVGHWFTYEGIPILLLPCFDCRIKVLREFLFSPSLAIWLFMYIRRYDIIHIHAIFSFPSTFAMIAARIMRVPYIIRTIGQLNIWSLNQSRFRKRLMLGLVERSNLQHSVAVHVTSKSEMEDLRRLKMDSNVLLLGLGVDLVDSFRFDHSRVLEKVTRFVFLSRLHPKKQLEVLLQALNIVRYRYGVDAWYLLVAGDGDEEYVKKLKSLALDLGLQKNIEWMGHITGQRKDELLQNVDWYVLPSASENFGISAVEALASGVPVIITDTVGISEMVSEHGAGIVVRDKPDDLSQVLFQAMGGPSPAMKDAARSLVRENYSWKQIAKRLSDFYLHTLQPLEE
jgi:glycosyltransferase involved in cell wall biosynthesis